MIRKMEDSQIIKLFFERSDKAITELSKKYGPICFRIANNILKNTRDAEECVNDTYLGLWNSIPPQNPDPLMSYVCKTARNTALKKYNFNTAIKRNSIYDVSLDELEYCVGGITYIEDECEINELTSSIEAFLECLDAESRVIFVRRYWLFDSITDIAKILSTNEHNITSRLYRIRQKLKKHLKKEGYEI